LGFLLKKKYLLPAVLWILVLTLGGVTAGNIAVNVNKSGHVTFGQGISIATACDDSISLVPRAQFINAAQYFKLESVDLSGVSSACQEKILSIDLLNPDGVTLIGIPFQFSFKDIGNGEIRITSISNPTGDAVYTGEKENSGNYSFHIENRSLDIHSQTSYAFVIETRNFVTGEVPLFKAISSNGCTSAYLEGGHVPGAGGWYIRLVHPRATGCAMKWILITSSNVINPGYRLAYLTSTGSISYAAELPDGLSYASDVCNRSTIGSQRSFAVYTSSTRPNNTHGLEYPLRGGQGNSFSVADPNSDSFILYPQAGPLSSNLASAWDSLHVSVEDGTCPLDSNNPFYYEFY
jgi:hypothetical protein